MHGLFKREIGTIYKSETGQCSFRVWAPHREKVELIRYDTGKTISMHRELHGYWALTLDDTAPGMEYMYRLDSKTDRPDPASHHQPDVHGPSRLIDHSAFQWEDECWKAIPLREMVQYEVHVGTFSPTGDFHGLTGELDRLRDLGINTLQIMPAARFPGERNWGYDGVYPFAVQDSYGGCDSFKHLVNEAHKKGMSVILDVVYNHSGPEGNYLHDFGPYFTNVYLTPWGSAINFDGPGSDEVRNFFIENAMHWFQRFHLDGLRLDAVHTIFDRSAIPFLYELKQAKDLAQNHLRKNLLLIAESDLNDSYLVRSEDTGGIGLDALWLDEFHHSVHGILTGENEGYYADFGSSGDLATSMEEGFVYSGRYSSFRKRTHGNRADDLSADKFILFIQNHDQTGNRMLGERLSALVEFPALKLAAGLLLLSPGIPMLFMGEEYGETSPFLYFVSHSDSDLNRAVRDGRKKEFQAFAWKGEPPDPSDPDTFTRSRPDPSLRSSASNGHLYKLYKELIALRTELSPLMCFERSCHRSISFDKNGVVILWRWDRSEKEHILVIFNASTQKEKIQLPLHHGVFARILDSSDPQFGGPGISIPATIASGDEIAIPPQSFALFRKDCV